MTEPSVAMVARATATRATIEQFRDQPFRLGFRDCVRMVAAHLRWFGHDIDLPEQGRYRSRRAAKQLLADRGYADLPDALDKLGFERIAPAAAIVGDILALPAQVGRDIGALAIALGNGRALGYHEQAIGAAVLQPKQIDTAWRVQA